MLWAESGNFWAQHSDDGVVQFVDLCGFADIRVPPARFTLSASRPKSCIEKTTILTDGASRRISRVASTPFMSGMVRSRTTTSGFRLSVFSTASWPFVASPQISTDGFVSR
jgi:hypothetical protein